MPTHCRAISRPRAAEIHFNLVSRRWLMRNDLLSKQVGIAGAGESCQNRRVWVYHRSRARHTPVSLTANG